MNQQAIDTLMHWTFAMVALACATWAWVTWYHYWQARQGALDMVKAMSKDTWPSSPPVERWQSASRGN